MVKLTVCSVSVAQRHVLSLLTEMGNCCRGADSTFSDVGAFSSKERRGFRAGLVHRHWRKNVWDSYQKLSIIGQGMTGNIYLAKHRETSEEVAIKCMEIGSIEQDLLDDLRNEIQILQMVCVYSS